MVELDLHLKLEKCTFTTSEVEYLGMIVKSSQLAMDPVKQKTEWYCTLANPIKSKRCLIVLRFHQFLSSIYFQLFHHHLSLYQLNQEKPSLELDILLAAHL